MPAEITNTKVIPLMTPIKAHLTLDAIEQVSLKYGYFPFHSTPDGSVEMPLWVFMSEFGWKITSNGRGVLKSPFLSIA